MANIKLKSIETDKLSNANIKQNYLYKDVMFDLQNEYSYNAQINKQEKIKDLNSLYDVEAVINSIVNCFLTTPGQKILNPEFGVDLRQYIFDPVDIYTTELIRSDIEEKLPALEPRINVLEVSVIADEEEQQYIVTMQINVPSLDIYGLSLRGQLNSNGYTLI